MSHDRSRLSGLRRERIPEPSVYTVLSNERRRRALQALRRRGDAVSVRELSEQIATEETGEDPAPRKARESVYVSLHQTHLPTLDEHGLIEYDQNRKVVHSSGRVRDVSPYLDVRSGIGVSWLGVYQWLGIAGLFAIVAALSGAPLIRAVPPLLLASGFLTLFAIATGLRLWRARGEIVRFFRSDPDSKRDL